jgi:hypothetical protein
MSEDFREYVKGIGLDFGVLTTDDKLVLRKDFDKIKLKRSDASQGITPFPFFLYCIHCIVLFCLSSLTFTVILLLVHDLDVFFLKSLRNYNLVFPIDRRSFVAEGKTKKQKISKGR